MNNDLISPQSSSPHVSITVVLPGQQLELPEVVQFRIFTLVPPPQVWEQGPKDQADQPPSPVGERESKCLSLAYAQLIKLHYQQISIIFENFKIKTMSPIAIILNSAHTGSLHRLCQPCISAPHSPSHHWQGVGCYISS